MTILLIICLALGLFAFIGLYVFLLWDLGKARYRRRKDIYERLQEWQKDSMPVWKYEHKTVRQPAQRNQSKDKSQ